MNTNRKTLRGWVCNERSTLLFYYPEETSIVLDYNISLNHHEIHWFGIDGSTPIQVASTGSFFADYNAPTEAECALFELEYGIECPPQEMMEKL